MFANWQLISISISYIMLLFLIAYLGDRYRHRIKQTYQPIIYALTLGVYCTSWSFLGTSGQAASNVLSHIPIFLGPILLFVFAWPFIQRMINVSLKLNITSIADLIASRYGKSKHLARLVTTVALVGTLPYLALQLKAIVYTFQQLQFAPGFEHWQLGLGVSLVLVWFTVIFGIRSIEVTERHPGVMLAIAFESLMKLIAFAAVGIFASFFLFDSPVDIWQQAQQKINLTQQFSLPNLTSMFGLLIVVMAAFLALPRQFQVMVVELKFEKDTWLSRRLFPLYLMVFALFAIPLGLAGYMLLGDTVPSDAYVLFLPQLTNNSWLTLLTFIGAISAASSMVIITAIALSTMISNEIVFPILFKSTGKSDTDFDTFRVRLLNVRKVLVFVVIMLGYGAFYFASPDTLSALGEIAFGAIGQLTPALITAFYSRSVTLKGVYSGIVVGFSMWLALNFLPELGLYAHPFQEAPVPSYTIITLLSLTSNIFVMWLVSQFTRPSVQERVQSALFFEQSTKLVVSSPKYRQLNEAELVALMARFVGESSARSKFEKFNQYNNKKHLSKQVYIQKLIEHTEQTLASVMGSSSARLVLHSALEGRDIALNELALLVEDASAQRLEFSKNLLQSAIENASEGISIVDGDLNLVAWNKRYVELFEYPKELLYVGCPIEPLIRFNVEKGLTGPGDVDKQVARRVNFLKQGSPHNSERQHNNGKVISIQGNPLPDGGFVMLFTDITTYRQAERYLKEANLDLESRVIERTQKLEETNRELEVARERSETAHIKKSQYLNAVSHDLMQPLEAARLFTSALASQPELTDEQLVQVNNINDSLKVANDLLANLGEIARIESGNIHPQFDSFSLTALFEELKRDFSAVIDKQQVEVRFVKTEVWVKSDRHLLRRILQNLLGNAIRYTAPGKVLLGVRRSGNNVVVQVLDNGDGIPLDKQQLVFEQFTQLNTNKQSGAKGLGLGLSITKSLAELLNHPLTLTSRSGHGCNFSITIPQAVPQFTSPVATPTPKRSATAQSVSLQGVTVLCIDNDPAVLNGMVELLKSWQCNVISAASTTEAKEKYQQQKDDIAIALVDYQLENDRTGIKLIEELRSTSERYLPAILITATTEVGIEHKAANADLGFMRKLVKPAALRALINAKLAERLRKQFVD
ncbi:PAS-domain containing protein [Psychrosphaera sp. B3R10]|uniref:hybrid sensor histidine kinase/response regulator n=1 Tax=unclassified Psychrosphaera TaxID=2641570 RepID=UPI001C085E8D|nr:MULTISPECIES: PAS-domain containing protein [unclassified Psychrosphaera]MBU2880642.1 PAS-domain containing protein [Psychrosphaera sp. I2R16]MBU2990728.1 PAS-domain containing protein [Psychrosphaera sp. B3R10]